MIYRNEVKHLITPADRAAICANLRVVAKPDEHAGPAGTYRIRSLYFDSATDVVLRENLAGISDREKFRLRYYNDDTDFIRLEKKVKRGGLGTKFSEPVTAEECRRILSGDTLWMASCGRPLITELYCKMKSRGLRPRSIVDYDRIPFVYGPGNVRVTIDYNIRTGLTHTDFLDPSCPMIPAADQTILLEVKWDEFLPSVIRRAVQVKNRRETAFSKYRMSRIYG